MFRGVSVFLGDRLHPAAGGAAAPYAAGLVLRLMDCSLLVSPRVDPGRPDPVRDAGGRCGLRGLSLLAEAGEDGEAAAALGAYAANVAAEASIGLHTGTTEVASLRHLDAEDATVSRALAWAMDHDPGTALRLALALEPWWQIRGRLTGEAPLLAAAAEYAAPGSDEWCGTRLCLGQAAGQSGDVAAVTGGFRQRSCVHSGMPCGLHRRAAGDPVDVPGWQVRDAGSDGPGCRGG